jgi:hypothetical protein
MGKEECRMKNEERNGETIDPSIIGQVPAGRKTKRVGELMDSKFLA